MKRLVFKFIDELRETGKYFDRGGNNLYLNLGDKDNLLIYAFSLDSLINLNDKVKGLEENNICMPYACIAMDGDKVGRLYKTPLYELSNFKGKDILDLDSVAELMSSNKGMEVVLHIEDEICDVIARKIARDFRNNYRGEFPMTDRYESPGRNDYYVRENVDDYSADTFVYNYVVKELDKYKFFPKPSLFVKFFNDNDYASAVSFYANNVSKKLFKDENLINQYNKYIQNTINRQDERYEGR